MNKKIIQTEACYSAAIGTHDVAGGAFIELSTNTPFIMYLEQLVLYSEQIIYIQMIRRRHTQ